MTKLTHKPDSCARQLRRVVALLARPLRPKLQDEGIGAAKLSVIGQLRISVAPARLEGWVHGLLRWWNYSASWHMYPSELETFYGAADDLWQFLDGVLMKPVVKETE